MCAEKSKIFSTMTWMTSQIAELMQVMTKSWTSARPLVTFLHAHASIRANASQVSGQWHRAMCGLLASHEVHVPHLYVLDETQQSCLFQLQLEAEAN